MSRQKAKRMIEAGVTFGQLRAFFLADFDPFERSTLNPRLTKMQARDIMGAAIKDRPDDERLVCYRYDPMRRRDVATRDFIIASNILREFGR